MDIVVKEWVGGLEMFPEFVIIVAMEWIEGFEKFVENIDNDVGLDTFWERRFLRPSVPLGH